MSSIAQKPQSRGPGAYQVFHHRCADHHTEWPRHDSSINNAARSPGRQLRVVKNFHQTFNVNHYQHISLIKWRKIRFLPKCLSWLRWAWCYHANNQNTNTNNNKPYILIYGMHTAISILIYGMPTQKNARDSHMRHHPVDIEFKIKHFLFTPFKTSTSLCYISLFCRCWNRDNYFKITCSVLEPA